MKIFVSHAVANKAIAQLVVNLLKLAGDIPKGDIFLSSSRGDIPNGTVFVQEILNSLNAANLVVAIISNEYMASKFCLAEIGAAKLKQVAKTGDVFTLLIPPATYADLEGVLYGTQSGKIDDPSMLDELLDRVIAGAPSPPGSAIRNQERDNFLSQVATPLAEGEANALLSRIPAVDLFFERDVTVNYKLKVRVVFRNETGQEILVNRATWDAKPNQVQVRPDQNTSLQLETGGGWPNNRWGSELGSGLVVPPNKVFRVWIGLDWDVPEIEIRRRHERCNVGTLRLPIRINNRDVTLEKAI